MVDESRLIEPPEIPQDQDFVRFNVLFAHLFAALARSQSMANFQINP